MPSRAAQAGPGGFSYYDHVFLPENEKDLTWAHAGSSYRSQVVIRPNGRRRTEAFLHRLDDHGRWQPVRLDDGTISDGKVETYTRCVEALCGRADTFFTSVFSAQGKRQLSAYRNAEIKGLLADLLGQEDIRALGQKAGETARQLKAALAAVRAEGEALDTEHQRLADDLRRSHGADERMQAAQASRQAAQVQLEAARTREASLLALHEQAKAVESRRAQLVEELAAASAAGDRTLQDLHAQDREATEQLARLDRRIAQRVGQARVLRQRLESRVRTLQRALADEAVVARAGRRLPLAIEVLRRRGDHVELTRDAVLVLARRRDAVTGLEQRLASVEREAGQAALQAEDLSRRLALSDRVPCTGMAMQGQCPLLSDARDAAVLAPGAQQRIRQLAGEREALRLRLRSMREAVSADAGAPQALGRAERRLRQASARQAAYAALAARHVEMAQARAGLGDAAVELAALAVVPDPSDEAGIATDIDTDTDTEAEAAERQQIIASRARIAGRRSLLEGQTQASIQRPQAAIDALPAPVDAGQLAHARAEVGRWQGVVVEAERGHLAAVRDAQALAALATRVAQHRRRREAAAARTTRVEHELANWLLFARCMGNDGLIALAIDDAGPTLSGL